LYILAIESSSFCGGVALIDEKSLLGEITFCSSKTYSTRLLPEVDQLLLKTGLNLKDISLIAVSLGPGSFTGLRIGLSNAKAMAMALDIPIIGIPTLDAFAFNVLGREGEKVFSIIRARKKEIYGAFFEFKAGIPRAISEYMCIKNKDIPSIFKSRDINFIICDSDTLSAIKDIEEMYNLANSIPIHLRHLRAANVASLALAYFKEKGRGDDIETLDPIYVRAPLS